MTEKNTAGKDKPAPTGEHILEVITGAFESPEVEYHKLFLFDRLTRGEKNWHFLIVTRRARDDRLELAAFSYELGPHGNLQTKLESRKARIPAERLGEVIDSLLIRLDEFDSEFREISLGGLEQAPSKLEYLRDLLGEKPDESNTGENRTNDLQPGQSPEM
jgi:hypothetical protein